jgi:hypothetical protein
MLHMTKGLVWLIERAHQVPIAPYLNAPLHTEWRMVGQVRARNRKRAMDRAVEITGASRSVLRVSGIHIGGK